MTSTMVRSSHAMSSATVLHPRRIVHRTRGNRHGPIVRLVSPGELGELIKPFVFLDRIDVDADAAPRFGFHPHSGIATLTLLLEGGASYEDSTGATGIMEEGAVEWMQAGGGVWHTGTITGRRISGYQLWVALPAESENAPAFSRYLDAEDFGWSGPARVVLGELDGIGSPIPAPSPINFLDVRLRSGSAWRYEPPPGHDVAWIAVHRGALDAPETVGAGELAVFEEGEAAIDFVAHGDTDFILGSAVKHPHELSLGHYSVHTNRAALQRGEARIGQIGQDLRRAGKI